MNRNVLRSEKTRNIVTQHKLNVKLGVFSTLAYIQNEIFGEYNYKWIIKITNKMPGSNIYGVYIRRNCYEVIN